MSVQELFEYSAVNFLEGSGIFFLFYKSKLVLESTLHPVQWNSCVKHLVRKVTTALSYQG